MTIKRFAGILILIGCVAGLFVYTAQDDIFEALKIWAAAVGIAFLIVIGLFMILDD